MSGVPTQLADLARGDLGSLRAFLSGRGTRGTSLAARLDARHDTERQDTALLTWAARHGQAEAARLLLEGGASVGATSGGGASAGCISRARRSRLSAPGCSSRLLAGAAAVNQARSC